MARFTNFATLTYTGGATNSNTVTGEVLEVLTLTKEAATAAYAANGRIPYVLSLVNSGTAAITNLTLTDDLGAYTLNGVTRYPRPMQRTPFGIMSTAFCKRPPR